MQVFIFIWREDIWFGDFQYMKKFCFDVIFYISFVMFYDCYSMKGNQLWKYCKDKILYYFVSGSCMDCSESDYRIFMNICNLFFFIQQWLFEYINLIVLEKFNRN